MPLIKAVHASIISFAVFPR